MFNVSSSSPSFHGYAILFVVIAAVVVVVEALRVRAVFTI